MLVIEGLDGSEFYCVLDFLLTAETTVTGMGECSRLLQAKLFQFLSIKRSLFTENHTKIRRSSRTICFYVIQNPFLKPRFSKTKITILNGFPPNFGTSIFIQLPNNKILLTSTTSTIKTVLLLSSNSLIPSFQNPSIIQNKKGTKSIPKRVKCLIKKYHKSSKKK